MHIQIYQRGFALITALLIVALATIISVNIATGLQMDMRRTTNMLANEQAMHYALEAENILRWGLREDRKNNNFDYYRDTDSQDINERWSDTYEFKYGQAIITSWTIDLQACFNLNSLVNGGSPDPDAQDIFRRLVSSVASSNNLSVRGDLSQAVIDWIDNDLNVLTPDGAEDGYYMNLEHPYRPANTPIQSASELRLIKGFEDNELYKNLVEPEDTAPLVCAFGETADINVNTAPAEVLNSWRTDINGNDIEKERESAPFKDEADFIGRAGLSKIKPAPSNFSVSTEYFLLTTEITLGDSRTLMYSIIHRDNTGKTQVIARSQGAY